MNQSRYDTRRYRSDGKLIGTNNGREKAGKKKGYRTDFNRAVRRGWNRFLAGPTHSPDKNLGGWRSEVTYMGLRYSNQMLRYMNNVNLSP